MFLIIIAVLVVGQMYFEYVIVKALHLESFNKKFILGNLAFSIAMSIGFGMLFPAAGMTIAAAGLISTILSQPMYRFTEWYIHNVKPKALAVHDSYIENQAVVHETFIDIWKLMKLAGAIIRLPFRFIHFFVTAVDEVKDRSTRGQPEPITTSVRSQP